MLQASKEDTALQGCRIMVVEDQPLEALDYSDRLSGSGAEVVGPFRSVAEAVDCLREQTVDVALLDYALSDSNSAQLQEELDSRDIPFVVLTGYPPVLVRRDDTQLVLSKPVSAELLLMTLGAAAKSAAARR
jgi:CheY-like chemotaxis protein